MRSLLWMTCVVAVLFAAEDALACSQCLCGSPTPAGYLLDAPAGVLSYGIEDRYLSKENGLDDGPGMETQVEHRISPLVVYRPSARLSFQARWPYAIKTNTQNPTGSPETIMRSTGMGDLNLVGRFDAIHSDSPLSRRKSIATILSLTAPTGSNDRTDATGERLDAHLQPGTGAWSLMGGLAGDMSLRSSAWTASVLARVNETNAHGYRYGSSVLFNTGYARTLSSNWEGALELNGRTSDRDLTEAGTFDPNSGGTLVYLAPSLRWTWMGATSVRLLVQVPVFQSLYGVQIEHASAILGVTYSGH
jgi:hypothetical protein